MGTMVADKKVKELEGARAELTITVDAASVEKAYAAQLAKYAKEVQIDGFRKGKVPASVLERKFGDSIREESTFKVMEEGLEEALKDIPDNQKPIPFSTPELQNEESLLPFKKDQDVTFSVIYDIYPRVELPEYKGLTVEVPTVEITDKDVEDKDSLVVYSSSDSIDFTEPRDFRVYANDGTAYRSYTVKVNVHKEHPDSINWQDMGECQAFKSMSGMKAVALGGKLFVFGATSAGTAVYSASAGGSLAWAELDTDIALDGGAYKNVVVKDDAMYTLSDGGVLRSDDGKAWDEVGGTGLKQLLAAGKDKLYALDGNGGIVVSEDDGATWDEDNIMDDAGMLPTENVSYGCLPVATDKNAERVVIVGNRDINNSAFAEDSVAMVWSKIEEYSDGSRTHSWVFNSEDNGYRLPRLADLSVAVYGDALVALGGRGLGTSTAEAFSGFYVSEDSGITWHADGTLYLPEGFTNADKDVFAMVSDDDNYLWIICGGTGKVWRGRLNRLGWEDVQTSFTE